MKIVLNDTNSGYNLNVINDNFQRIEEEFQNKVLYRDNPVGEPNQLQQSIDANGFTLYNVATPTLFHQAAPKSYVDGIVVNAVGPYIDQAKAYAESAGASVAIATSAATAASNAANSAANSASMAAILELATAGHAADASASAAEASLYSSFGLGAGGAFDFGFVTDPFVVFPTDFGTI